MYPTGPVDPASGLRPYELADGTIQVLPDGFFPDPGMQTDQTPYAGVPAEFAPVAPAPEPIPAPPTPQQAAPQTSAPPPTLPGQDLTPLEAEAANAGVPDVGVNPKSSMTGVMNAYQNQSNALAEAGADKARLAALNTKQYEDAQAATAQAIETERAQAYNAQVAQREQAQREFLAARKEAEERYAVLQSKATRAAVEKDRTWGQVFAGIFASAVGAASVESGQPNPGLLALNQAINDSIQDRKDAAKGVLDKMGRDAQQFDKTQEFNAATHVQILEGIKARGAAQLEGIKSPLNKAKMMSTLAGIDKEIATRKQGMLNFSTEEIMKSKREAAAQAAVMAQMKAKFKLEQEAAAAKAQPQPVLSNLAGLGIKSLTGKEGQPLLTPEQEKVWIEKGLAGKAAQTVGALDTLQKAKLLIDDMQSRGISNTGVIRDLPNSDREELEQLFNDLANKYYQELGLKAEGDAKRGRSQFFGDNPDSMFNLLGLKDYVRNLERSAGLTKDNFNRDIQAFNVKLEYTGLTPEASQEFRATLPTEIKKNAILDFKKIGAASENVANPDPAKGAKAVEDIQATLPKVMPLISGDESVYSTEELKKLSTSLMATFEKTRDIGSVTYVDADGTQKSALHEVLAEIDRREAPALVREKAIKELPAGGPVGVRNRMFF